ncbi:hypothetical protein THIOM_004682 [Candidatus Thiomargarita nelsonii]|uniref:BACON domain-containing protein n=1 Tax=Candidatus Thiomargarita nelsonii TaxID=1003181 RepID=A0A176RVB4_9GAMM|nr:hypothetical protein THIOM_004682 [Candidatus Thiomargarita nelsonii]
MLLLLTGQVNATLLGPIPYTSFTDSPFFVGEFSYFYLEDFEDHLFNTPGVTSSAGGVVSVVFGPSLHDSVDADDGVIDGSGLAGNNFFSWNGAVGITFTFDAGILGALPTHVGIVWTDGAGTTTFKAFNADGVSLGTIGPVSIADGNHNGATGEDNFFGAIDLGGISSIFISNTSGGIEIDHLQFGVSNCADVNITPTNFSHSSSAESGTVTINASPECSWTATSNTDWATLTFGESGNGNGTVTYSITANPSHKSRQGTLTIAGQTFTITQEGIECSYSITPTSQSHSSNAETGSVQVSASGDCPWTASSNISWANIASGGSGNGDGTVTYAIMENTGTTREGTLTIAGQSFTITQAGKQSPHPTCSTTDDELVFTKLKEFYAVGEIVEVDLVACATSRFDRADLWVAIELPSEEVLFMTTNPFEPFSLTPQVFRKSVANTKANYHILQFEVPPDLGGKYTFYAVYVKDT